MISIKNLSKKFGTKKVLTGISVDFHKGNVYGIIGVNGAGKTTLLRCLTSLEKFEGEIDTSFKSLKETISFLPTQPYFFPLITGKEYLRLLSNANDIEISDFETKNVFNLPLNEYASKYSTGMKKKLALTGILIQNKAVYILDEPFNGVDIQSNSLIIEIVKKLKELNKIVILTSHIFSTLSETCDEIFLLKNGKIENQFEPSNFNEIEKELLDNNNKIFDLGLTDLE